MKTYQRLNLVEREEISRYLVLDCSCRQIATVLNRSTSTITREIRRCQITRLKYRAVLAHQRSRQVARKSRRQRKLDTNRPLNEFVFKHLHLRWSPEQIVKRLKFLYPSDMEMHVSHETIYAYLYIHPRGMLKRRLVKQLRRKHINCRLKPKQGSVEVNFVNGYVFDIFKGLGFPVGLKGEINIPHFLMRTPLERRVISGIFATDGSLVITNNNGTMYPRVEFRSSSVTLLRQIRRVLKRCGMKGGLYPKYTRLQYNGNSNLELFVSKVGFLNPKQNDKYKQWMQSSSVGVAHGRMMRHAAGKAW